MKYSQAGIATPVIIGTILVIVFGTGVLYLASHNAEPIARQTSTPEPSRMEKDSQAMMKEKEQSLPQVTGDTMLGKGNDSIKTYAGTVLAGAAAPLLDFTESDYDAALKTNKLIVLYFYANWCPICKAEFPEMQKAFDGLTTDQVIGFRVNYNDSQTDPDEKKLAQQFGVAYQHTKVFVQNGQRILKSPEGWDTARYQQEIQKALYQ